MGNIPATSPHHLNSGLIFYKYNKFYGMKVIIIILSMYQTQISIHSVISISLTQKISDIKLVRGRCRDIAKICIELIDISIYSVICILTPWSRVWLTWTWPPTFFYKYIFFKVLLNMLSLNR